jgi:excisionase family DNA binding protein
LRVSPGFAQEKEAQEPNLLPSCVDLHSPGAGATERGNKLPDGTALLSVEDAARLLRTSPRAVYIMAGRGVLPGVIRIGRRLLVRREDLVRWLDESRAPSPAEDRR